MDRFQKPDTLVQLEQSVRKIFKEKFLKPDQAFEIIEQTLKNINVKAFKEKLIPALINDNKTIKTAYFDRNNIDEDVKLKIYGHSSVLNSASKTENDVTIFDEPRQYRVNSELLDDKSRRNTNYQGELNDQLKTHALGSAMQDIYFSILENGSISESKLHNLVKSALNTKLKVIAKGDIENARVERTIDVFNANEKAAIVDALDKAITNQEKAQPAPTKG